MKLSLLQKQVAAFILVGMLASIAGGYLFFSMRAVTTEFTEVTGKVDEAHAGTSDLATYVAQQVAALRGYVLTKSPTTKTDFQTATTNVDKGIELLRSYISDPADLQTVDQFSKQDDTWVSTIAERAFTLVEQGNTQQAIDLITQQGVPMVKAMMEATSALNQRYEQLAEDKVAAAQKSAVRAQVVGGISMVVAAILAIALGIFLARSLSRPVIQVAEAARRLADGDLTVEPLKVASQDEVGQMARAFNQMLTNLHTLIMGVSRNTELVAASSEQLSSSASQAAQSATESSQAVASLAAGASQQASSASDVNRTMDELRQTIGQIAQGATQAAGEVTDAAARLNQMSTSLEVMTRDAASVARETESTAETAKVGAEVVEKTVAGMQRIKSVVGETATHIEELERFSEQIGAITDVISGIADQTNLLALNAAIEAARAGEHGRGFAVVAEEVRKLAERSASSAKEISGLIQNIQGLTADAVRAMAAGTREVEAGSQLAAEAGRSLEVILSTVQRSAQAVSGIAAAASAVQKDAESVVLAFDALAALTEENTAATEQMAAGSMEVTGAVDKIAQVSRSNAAVSEEVSASVEELTATSEEVASAANELRKVAADLKGQVAHFRV